MPSGVLNQSLEQCFSGVEARAAVVVERGGSVAAFSGRVAERAKIASAVLSRCCEDGGRLVGFLKLGNEDEAMLCAAPLSENLVMALLFEPTIALQKANASLKQIAECLLRLGGLEKGQAEEQTAASPLPDSAGSEEEYELPPEAFMPLFDDVPPPDPGTAGETPPEQRAEIAAPPLPPKRCSCVLAPLPPHRLEGETAKQVRQALAALAQERGWELKSVRVAPEYLQFSLTAPPETTIGEILRSVRERTAAALGTEGAFWRPSYLLGAVERIAPKALGEAT